MRPSEILYLITTWGCKMAQVRRIRTTEEKLHIEFTPEEVSETVVAAAVRMTSDEGWKLLDARIDEYRGATVILVREDVE